MTDDRYNSLKKKYDALLEENEHLRAKILKLESQPNSASHIKTNLVQSTQSKQKDISVLRETCSHFDRPIAIERSKSGNGCHAWIFFEEKSGRQFHDNMTPAKASDIRSQRIEGKDLTNEEKRAERKAKKAAEAGKYTINKLWEEYSLNRTSGKGLDIDTSRYEHYPKAPFGNKEPRELLKLDVDRVRIKLLKKKSPQTVKHVLNLLTWIINYGVKNNFCQIVSFQIQKPTENNEKTEDLDPGQLEALLAAIEADGNIAVGNMMKLALYSGMRRGEPFNLKWNDVDFETGFIWIRGEG